MTPSCTQARVFGQTPGGTTDFHSFIHIMFTANLPFDLFWRIIDTCLVLLTIKISYMIYCANQPQTHSKILTIGIGDAIHKHWIVWHWSAPYEANTSGCYLLQGDLVTGQVGESGELVRICERPPLYQHIDGLLPLPMAAVVLLQEFWEGYGVQVVGVQDAHQLMETTVVRHCHTDENIALPVTE